MIRDRRADDIDRALKQREVSLEGSSSGREARVQSPPSAERTTGRDLASPNAVPVPADEITSGTQAAWELGLRVVHRGAIVSA